MKNINDFIGKKVAIHCKTQEEWDYVRKFDTDNVLIPRSCFKNSSMCFSISDSSFSHASKEWYVALNYTILEASDFMPTEPTREIGWFWKEGFETKYKKAVGSIIGIKDGYNFDFIALDNESEQACLLREAGVLDLWFEPVYKEVKQWQKEGTPCLVWGSDEPRILFRYANGDGLFYPDCTKNGSGIQWDNYIELIPENLDKLPFNK